MVGKLTSSPNIENYEVTLADAASVPLLREKSRLCHPVRFRAQYTLSPYQTPYAAIFWDFPRHTPHLQRATHTKKSFSSLRILTKRRARTKIHAYLKIQNFIWRESDNNNAQSWLCPST